MEEFIALRAEIISNSTIVANLMVMMLTFTVVALGAIFAREKKPPISYLVLYLINIPILMFISSQIDSTFRIATYIKVFLENDFTFHWENNLSLLRYIASIEPGNGATSDALYEFSLINLTRFINWIASFSAIYVGWLYFLNEYSHVIINFDSRRKLMYVLSILKTCCHLLVTTSHGLRQILITLISVSLVVGQEFYLGQVEDTISLQTYNKYTQEWLDIKKLIDINCGSDEKKKITLPAETFFRYPKCKKNNG